MPRRASIVSILAGLFATASLLPSIAPAQQVQEGTRIRINAAEITFVGRVQAQYNTSSVDGVDATEMLLRRVRFGVNVRLNDVVSGRIQPEFASVGGVALGDAYMQVGVSPAFQVWAGRAHRPFGVMEQMSSLVMVPIERGVRIRGVTDFDMSNLVSGLRYGDRDTGLQIRGAPAGAPLGLAYALGVFGGPLQGASGGETTQQYVARLMVSPLPATRVGFAWSRRDFARPPVPGSVQLTPGSALLMDVEYGSVVPAPHSVYFVAQGTTGDFDPVAGVDFLGAQAWLAYRLPLTPTVPIVEPLLRVSHGSVDTAQVGPRGGTLVTPGVNFWLGGQNRILLNYDVWSPKAGTSENSLKLQFQMAF
jgi:hypothetical protein